MYNPETKEDLIDRFWEQYRQDYTKSPVFRRAPIPYQPLQQPPITQIGISHIVDLERYGQRVMTQVREFVKRNSDQTTNLVFKTHMVFENLIGCIVRELNRPPSQATDRLTALPIEEKLGQVFKYLQIRELDVFVYLVRDICLPIYLKIRQQLPIKLGVDYKLVAVYPDTVIIKELVIHGQPSSYEWNNVRVEDV